MQQMTIWDYLNQDTQSGKMFSEVSAATKAKISEPCWSLLQGSDKQKFLFLNLAEGNGRTPEPSSVMDGLLRGDLWTLNIGESPNAVKESHLSQILEETPHPKYSLSAKACQGILRRAEKRGKELPSILQKALERQAGLSVSKNEPENPGGGKGILIQNERTGALSTLNNQRVVCGISAYDSNAMKSSNPHSGIYQAETARTLDLNGGSPACNQGGMAVVYDARGNTSPTLTGDHQNRVTDYTAIAVVGEPIYHSSKNSYHTDFKDDSAVDTLVATDYKDPPTVCEGPEYIVRRLTPLECERLQNYPDGWTDIPGASDTARYKALGNSIALPQWVFILSNISKHLPAKATLGSLFDGISGFPLIWQRLHGTSSARWASEIEKFPISVTKYHFGAE